jgi:hypothetical protein
MLDDLVNGHHTSMIEPGRRPRLTKTSLAPLPMLVFGQVGREKEPLGSNIAIQAFIPGSPHYPETTPTDPFDKTVLPTDQFPRSLNHSSDNNCYPS